MRELPLSLSLTITACLFASFATTDFLHFANPSSCAWHLSAMMDECKWGVARATGRPGAAVASRGRTGTRWWPCLYVKALFRPKCLSLRCLACWPCVICNRAPLRTALRPQVGTCSGQTIIPSHWEEQEFHCLGRSLEWQHQMNLLHQCLTLEDTRRCNSFPAVCSDSALIHYGCLWILL